MSLSEKHLPPNVTTVGRKTSASNVYAYGWKTFGAKCFWWLQMFKPENDAPNVSWLKTFAPNVTRDEKTFGSKCHHYYVVFGVRRSF